MTALNLFNTKIKKNRVPHQNDQPVLILWACQAMPARTAAGLNVRLGNQSPGKVFRCDL
jgi:hypothetical protein